MSSSGAAPSRNFRVGLSRSGRLDCIEMINQGAPESGTEPAQTLLKSQLGPWWLTHRECWVSARPGESGPPTVSCSPPTTALRPRSFVPRFLLRDRIDPLRHQSHGPAALPHTPSFVRATVRDRPDQQSDVQDSRSSLRRRRSASTMAVSRSNSVSDSSSCRRVKTTSEPSGWASTRNGLLVVTPEGKVTS